MNSSQKKHSKSGATLMAVLFIIAVMSAVVGVVYSVTTTEGRFMERSTDRAIAIAYGDGVIQNLFDQWRLAASSTNLSDSGNVQRSQGFTYDELMNGTATSPDTTLPKTSSGTALLPLQLPTSSQLPVPAGMSVGSWSVVPADPYLNPVGGSSATLKVLRPTQENGTNSKSLLRTYYLASVTVNYRHGGQVTVQRPFVRAGRNMFDNFLFSTQPITEINPGAPMYVNGPVYIGGNLYTDTPNLNFEGSVTYTGQWTIGLAPGDPHTVGAGSPTWPSNNVPHVGAQQKLLDAPISSLDPNFLDRPNTNDADSDGNLNNDGFHEIVQPAVTTNPNKPAVAQTDPLQIDSATSERLSNNADYQIFIDANNNVTINKGSQNSTTGVITYSSLTTGSDYTAIMNAITTNTTLVDGREGDNVRTVNVDVSKVATSTNAGTVTDNVGKGDGLLLYIQDTSAGQQVTTNGVSGYTTKASATGNLTTTGGTATTSHTRRGIRLVNGGSLPNMGLTVATPNPAYIQGDYNSGATTNYSSVAGGSSSANALTVSNLPPSDGSSAYPSGTSSPTEYSGAYTKKSAAVVADAVTVLSNSWSDGNSVNGTSSRVPSNTTVNAAIVAGNVPTTPPNADGSVATGAVYSGGIENFPRLLENWTGSLYLTVHGSFGLLYDSEQALGAWNGSVYGVPSRRWFYDTILQDKNPPGFPVAYSYGMGAWAVK